MARMGEPFYIRFPPEVIEAIEQFQAENSTRATAMSRSGAVRALVVRGLASMSKPQPQPEAESCPVPQVGPVPGTDGLVALDRADEVGHDDEGRAVYSCQYRGNTGLATQMIESALVGLYRYTSRGYIFDVDYRMTAEEVRALGEDISGALHRALAGVA